MATIAEQLTELNQTKQAIKNAIIEKGVSMDNVPFTNYATKVAEIESGGLTINGIIEQYVVNAGATVNAGDFVEFVRLYSPGTFPAQRNYFSAVALSENIVFMAYADSANGSSSTAQILDFSGEIPVLGTPVVFNSASTSTIAVAALTESSVLVAYQDTGNSYYGTAQVLTISGTTITTGTEKVFNSASTSYIAVVALTESSVLVAYQDIGKSYYGTAQVLTISGTTITTGIESSFNRATTYDISLMVLTQSSVLVAYRNNSYGTAQVLTISGKTITTGTATWFKSGTTNLNAVLLTDTSALVTYNYGTDAYAQVLTISSTTITYGTEVQFYSGSALVYVCPLALTESSVLVAYQDTGKSNYGTAQVLTISGTTITTGSKVVFFQGNVGKISGISKSSSSVLLVYSKGYCSLSINGTQITVVPETEGGTFVQPVSGQMYVGGLANTSGSAGEIVDVYVPNV